MDYNRKQVKAMLVIMKGAENPDLKRVVLTKEHLFITNGFVLARQPFKASFLLDFSISERYEVTYESLEDWYRLNRSRALTGAGFADMARPLEANYPTNTNLDRMLLRGQAALTEVWAVNANYLAQCEALDGAGKPLLWRNAKAVPSNHPDFKGLAFTALARAKGERGEYALAMIWG